MLDQKEIVDSSVGQFRNDVLVGLKQDKKSIPCKYFYDERGSKLFEQICDVEEYYLTDCEIEIMKNHAHEMAACMDEDSVLVEFGSGSSVKTRFLLDSVKHSIAYVPVDVSSSHLTESAEALRDSYPEILIEPVVADFTKPFTIPNSIPADAPVTIYFPGSTIGNFEPEEAEKLFQIIVSEMGGDHGALLIGIDLRKDAQVIEAAYNDEQGITAEFNLNLLHRINRELNGDLDVSQFEHRSVYNEAAGRIETSIVSKCSQEAVVAGERIQFESGEQIHTEYSYKYSIDEFVGFAARFGLAFDQSWLDSQKYFAVLRFVANGN